MNRISNFLIDILVRIDVILSSAVSVCSFVLVTDIEQVVEKELCILQGLKRENVYNNHDFMLFCCRLHECKVV